MKKRDYFIAALKADAWRHRIWIFSVFTVANLKKQPKPDDLWPYRLFEVDGKFQYWDPNTRALELIEDATPGTPIFGVKEIFVLEPGEIENNQAQIKTTYANALFNVVALTSAFGSKIPYVNGKKSPGAIEALFASRIVSNPGPGETVPEGKVTVAEVQRHSAAMHDVIQNLDKICVQSSSPAMLGVKPEVIALRDRLLEENKDSLNDITVVAGIIKQLIQADKDSFKGDPAEGFFIKDKHFSVVRLRTRIMHGIEYSFDDDGTFELVTKSLEEGWDFTKFPALNNSLRDGSYNRGAKTALGGEAVKFFYRRYQNSHLVKGDCGTPICIPRRVTKANAKRLVGNYYVDSTGALQHIETGNVSALIGQTLQMRDPAGCRAGGFDYCEICFGNALEDAPEMIANVMAEVASRFMSIFMAKMHGTQLRTTLVDFKYWFR